MTMPVTGSPRPPSALVRIHPMLQLVTFRTQPHDFERLGVVPVVPVDHLRLASAPAASAGPLDLASAYGALHDLVGVILVAVATLPFCCDFCVSHDVPQNGISSISFDTSVNPDDDW